MSESKFDKRMQAVTVWRGHVATVLGFGVLAAVAVAMVEAFGWDVAMVSPPSSLELAYLAGAYWLAR